MFCLNPQPKFLLSKLCFWTDQVCVFTLPFSFPFVSEEVCLIPRPKQTPSSALGLFSPFFQDLNLLPFADHSIPFWNFLLFPVNMLGIPFAKKVNTYPSDPQASLFSHLYCQTPGNKPFLLPRHILCWLASASASVTTLYSWSHQQPDA